MNLKLRKSWLAGAAAILATVSVFSVSAEARGPYGYGARGLAPRAAFAPRGWNGGHWVHGWHGPRQGWWWTVGSSWYLYPRPTYPYPAYGGYDSYDAPYAAGDLESKYYPAYDYSDYGLDPNGYNPPSPYQYYCDRPAGFYPQVRDCENWQQFYQGKPVTYDDERQE